MMPHDLDMERAVLGAMICSRDDALEAVERLTAMDFYKGNHRTIFDVARAVFERDQCLDGTLLIAELKKRNQLEEVNGAAGIGEVVGAAPQNTLITPYLDAIREHSLKRQLIAAATECLRGGMDGKSSADVAGEFAAALARVEEQMAGGHPSAAIGDILGEVFSRLDAARPMVWPTGIVAFDKMFDGVLPGELIVIAAKRKGGKSTLALQWARHWAKQGEPVLVCSYEMSKEQVAQVLTAAEAGVCLRKDWDSPERTKDIDEPKIDAARKVLAALPIFIEQSAGKRLHQLEATARLYQRKHGMKVLIVDYLQLIEADASAERRDLEIAASSRRLKALAQNLSIPVVALSQLNDQGQTRESRSIEHDCDMLIHIEAPDNAGIECEAQLIVKASRSGPTGSIEVHWQRGWRRFDASTISGGRVPSEEDRRVPE
jgi:replicative DNA helicase